MYKNLSRFMVCDSATTPPSLARYLKNWTYFWSIEHRLEWDLRLKEKYWTEMGFTSFSAGTFTIRNALKEKLIIWPTSHKLNHQFLYLESGTNDDFHFSPNHKSSRLENITRGLLQQNAQIIQWSRKSLVLCELLSATKEIYRSSTVWKKI